MTQTDQLGPVMLDVAGTELIPEERERLRHPATGGVILFRRNYADPDQIIHLIADLRSQRPALLIAVDHEGGRVQRFRDGFTRLPPACRYEATGNPSLAEEAGWLMAAELRSVGVDFSFAPVLDVECGISQVIGDRAFGTQPDQVARFARAFAAGMRRAGMAAVGKHFPGHGGVIEDSHLALPVDSRTLAEIERQDLMPFRELLAAGLEGVMPAHVIYEQIDPHPAGFSPFWIGEMLRRRLGFNGAVFSDDLSMAGASYAGGYADRAQLALTAGCDMVLVCNAPEAAGQVLDARPDLSHANPCRSSRLERMRGRLSTHRHDLLNSETWRSAVERIANLNAEPLS